MGGSTDPMGCRARRGAAKGPHPAPIVSMSPRPGIPWRVALPQSPLPLPRLGSGCDETAVKATLLQRTATCPFFHGLTKRPHSILSPVLSVTARVLKVIEHCRSEHRLPQKLDLKILYSGSVPELPPNSPHPVYPGGRPAVASFFAAVVGPAVPGLPPDLP